MAADIIKEARWRAGSVFALCVLAIFFLSQLFRSFGLIWMFVFPFRLLAARDATQHWHYILSPSVAATVDIALWTFVTVAFAWPCGRVRAGFLLPLALATIVLVAFAIHLPVWWLGMDFYWDL